MGVTGSKVFLPERPHGMMGLLGGWRGWRGTRNGQGTGARGRGGRWDTHVAMFWWIEVKYMVANDYPRLVSRIGWGKWGCQR